jgi:hypothetical protein
LEVEDDKEEDEERRKRRKRRRGLHLHIAYPMGRFGG